MHSTKGSSEKSNPRSFQFHFERVSLLRTTIVARRGGTQFDVHRRTNRATSTLRQEEIKVHPLPLSSVSPALRSVGFVSPRDQTFVLWFIRRFSGKKRRKNGGKERKKGREEKWETRRGDLFVSPIISRSVRFASRNSLQIGELSRMHNARKLLFDAAVREIRGGGRARGGGGVGGRITDLKRSGREKKRTTRKGKRSCSIRKKKKTRALPITRFMQRQIFTYGGLRFNFRRKQSKL